MPEVADYMPKYNALLSVRILNNKIMNNDQLMSWSLGKLRIAKWFVCGVLVKKYVLVHILLAL